ncbi:hypothetical protein EJB05_37321, partial [Eragrostis curvula]
MTPPPATLMPEIVEEILLRVPPDDPAALARAALADKPWRRLISDAGFRRSSPASSPPPRSARRVLLCTTPWREDPSRNALVVWDPAADRERKLPSLPRCPASAEHFGGGHFRLAPAALAGNALYFLLHESAEMLKYDLATRAISMTNLLPNTFSKRRRIVLTTAEDGGLGFATVEGHFWLYLWSRETDPEAVVGWAPSKIVNFRTMLPTHALRTSPEVVAVADGNAAILLGTDDGLFAIDLKSGSANKVGEVSGGYYDAFPYACFCLPALSPAPAEMAGGASSRVSSGESNASLLRTLQNIPASFLKEITDNFSPERKLGKGAFGTVYKGILRDESTIAVKKLEQNSQMPAERQFTNEVGNLMAIQHENIVKLVGYCHESHKEVVEHNGKYIIVDVTETFLCYEYLPRGSLDTYLFESHRIDWDTRFNIIKGICKGLHFLHTGMDTPVVHMDIKPDNILLDDNMAPKISDFGLSRLFGKEQTRINTQNVVGALGYLAPEYLYRGEISTQSDIYSLGILILQIGTGDKITPNNEDKCGTKFIEQVRQKWTLHQITSTFASFDARRLQEVKMCIQIGFECVEDDRKKRPSIVDIVDRLSGKR